MLNDHLFERTADRILQHFERGLGCLAGESLLTYCLARELSESGYSLEAEVDISGLSKFQGRGLPVGYVYYDLLAKGQGREIFIETKFLKAGKKPLMSGLSSSAPLNARRLMNDIARLSLVSDSIGYLIVGRPEEITPPQNKTLAGGDILLSCESDLVRLQGEKLDMSQGAKQLFACLLSASKRVVLAPPKTISRRHNERSICIDFWIVSSRGDQE